MQSWLVFATGAASSGHLSYAAHAGLALMPAKGLAARNSSGIPITHAWTTKNSFVFRTPQALNVATRERCQTVAESGLYELRSSVPIIRLFRARARRGCERALADKLATSSVEVVQGQPGFLGHLVASPASEHEHEFIFASIWANADAVKARFGKQWRASLLPPGYAELIEACSVDHYHLTGQSLDRQSLRATASAAARRRYFASIWWHPMSALFSRMSGPSPGQYSGSCQLLYPPCA
jgi:quinol monooxygenase YgiN